MSSNKSIQELVLLKEFELQEAGRIVRLAFGTFSGIAQSARLHGRPQFDDAPLALAAREGDRRARGRPPDRIERGDALGIVRVLRTTDGAARILGPQA